MCRISFASTFLELKTFGAVIKFCIKCLNAFAKRKLMSLAIALHALLGRVIFE
jgi:hypothetical protein